MVTTSGDRETGGSPDWRDLLPRILQQAPRILSAFAKVLTAAAPIVVVVLNSRSGGPP
jgi:hypothetical protein